MEFSVPCHCCLWLAQLGIFKLITETLRNEHCYYVWLILWSCFDAICIVKSAIKIYIWLDLRLHYTFLSFGDLVVILKYLSFYTNGVSVISSKGLWRNKIGHKWDMRNFWGEGVQNENVLWETLKISLLPCKCCSFYYYFFGFNGQACRRRDRKQW